jgi:SPP1 gp7 family putative phage head morphogenesis protein
LFDLPERYADYLLEKRLIAEAYTLKRLEGISNLKLQVLTAEIEKTPYGLSMVYLRKKMGFEQLEQQVLFQFLMEWVSLGQAHASQEITKVMKMKENFNEGIKASTDYYKTHSLNLAGNFSKDQLTYTQEILKRGIAEGKTPKEMMNLIGEKFPNFSKHRLENIVRTESGRMYNHGRLTTFYANRDAVEGVRFSAIMDKRTSQICSSRHGLVLSLDEQDEIAANSPPLHFQCRSVWIPVSLFSSKKPNFESYRDKINLDTTRPLEGFGFKDLSGILPKNVFNAKPLSINKVADKASELIFKRPDGSTGQAYLSPSIANLATTYNILNVSKILQAQSFFSSFANQMGTAWVIEEIKKDIFGVK